MNITIEELKELTSNNVSNIIKDDLAANMIGKRVIIRTYSAGVHFGVLAARNGQEVKLTDTRRIWYWDGAFTLSAVAKYGINDKSKLSVTMPEIILTECIEIIPCSVESIENILAKPIYKGN